MEIKNNEFELGGEEEEDEVENPIDESEQEIPPESKEFFLLETPNGFKISVGSCCLRADALREIGITSYDYLIKEYQKKKSGGASYLR